MAPEQILADGAEPASDVFALGSVLAYAATGKGPFDATTVPAIMHRILTGEPALDGIGEPLSTMILGCLAKEPRDRPTPAEIADSIAAGSETAPGGPPERPWHSAVNLLIERQRSDLEERVTRSLATETLVDPDTTVIPESLARADTVLQTPPPRPISPEEPDRPKPDPAAERAVPQPTSGGTGADAKTLSSAAEPGTPSAGVAEKKTDARGIVIFGTLIVSVILLIGMIVEDNDSGSGDDDHAANSVSDTDNDVDDGYTDYAPPPTSSAPDPRAGCLEAANTISSYIDIANSAMESGDNARATNAFRDLAYELRVIANDANSTSVAADIRSIADDSDRLADAIIADDSESFSYWRDKWIDDRDELVESCRG